MSHKWILRNCMYCKKLTVNGKVCTVCKAAPKSKLRLERREVKVKEFEIVPFSQIGSKY